MANTLQPLTVDDFVRLIPDGQKADLLDGVICMASPDSPRAAQVNGFLSFLVLGYAREKGLGDVFGPRSAFALQSTYAPEPDIAFVRSHRSHLWRRAYFQGSPDLAVEIVSEDSIERDTGTKRRSYEQAGVEEYWIIDLLQGYCRFLRLQAGRYVDVSLEQGVIFRSQVLPGFWLDTRWLLEADIPKPLAVLQRILGS